MKVTTDACLFGAWVAGTFGRKKNAHATDGGLNNVLEIGTGTGLLSLMLAQKAELVIDTIEIDASACTQAKENVASSSWASRIQVICGDARHFQGEKRYDLIICNPPFFENQLRSESGNVNMARHDDTLRLEELIHIISRNLSPRGVFVLLLPYHRSEYCVGLARSLGFYLLKQVNVKQSTNHAYFRSMLHFAQQPATAAKYEELVIKDGENYTEDFISLLKDYYLNL